MKRCPALAGLIGALFVTAGAAAQVGLPGARPTCTSPGVPSGCTPPAVEEPRVPVQPQLPIPNTPPDESRRAADGTVTPPPTGDEAMEKPAPQMGPNSTPVIAPPPAGATPQR